MQKYIFSDYVPYIKFMMVQCRHTHALTPVDSEAKTEGTGEEHRSLISSFSPLFPTLSHLKKKNKINYTAA